MTSLFKQILGLKGCSCLKVKNVENPIKLSQKEKKTISRKYEISAPIKKELFVRNGQLLNQLGTTECGLVIDGSDTEYSIKLDRIIEWSSTRPPFDISHLHSILNNPDFRKHFTNRKRVAIDNIYYKWEVYMQYL